MKAANFVFILLSIIFIYSCSSSKTSEEQNDRDKSDASSHEYEDDRDDLFLSEDDKEGKKLPGSETITKAEKDSSKGNKDLRFSYYLAETDDTLMWISFVIYGTYKKWKEIAELNKDLFKHDDFIVKTGMRVKYVIPEKPFVWSPKGDPYLIVTGDTLSIISKKLYETPRRWRSLWENNKIMIKDPNLIFAGFILHYLPLNSLAALDKNSSDSSNSLEYVENAAQ